MFPLPLHGVTSESAAESATESATDPCSGCGACCDTQGTPPGYGVYFPPEGHQTPGWALDPLLWPDAVHWAAVPEPLRQELEGYYLSHHGGGDNRYELGLPCLWYDRATRRCRHYAHRPAACREFQPGEKSCNDYRRTLDLPPLPLPPLPLPLPSHQLTPEK